MSCENYYYKSQKVQPLHPVSIKKKIINEYTRKDIIIGRIAAIIFLAFIIVFFIYLLSPSIIKMLNNELNSDLDYTPFVCALMMIWAEILMVHTFYFKNKLD
jgi:ABC-type transport system involved in multi-copper enzyme maturation permease subunit